MEVIFYSSHSSFRLFSFRFNRISIEVLSVVAQQVLSIIGALMQKLKVFVFEGNDIRLTPTIGMFITMNPGYAGRYKI